MTEHAPAQRELTRRLRQVLVLMHMAAAFGWLTCSVAMLMLTAYGLGRDDPASRRSVFEAAAYLDDHLLADSSFMTIYTGLMVAGMAQWGFFRFWWVAVSMAVAVPGALAGRQVFPRLLADGVAGDPVQGGQLMAATLVTIAALGFVVWVGRAKPWGRIRASHGPVPPWGHPVLYVAVIVTPVVDYTTDLPVQVVPAAVVIGYVARRAFLGHRRSTQVRREEYQAGTARVRRPADR